MLDGMQPDSYRLTGYGNLLWIAERNYFGFKELNPELGIVDTKISKVLTDSENPEEPDHPYYDLQIEAHKIEALRDEQGITTIVFAALYLEALIYDYAASMIGDAYTNEHLDKLDFVSKWIVIPRIVTSEQPDKGQDWFRRLKQLSKARNGLVHMKSRRGMPISELSQYLVSAETELVENVENAFLAMYDCPKKIGRLDPENPFWRLIQQKPPSKPRSHNLGEMDD